MADCSNFECSNTTWGDKVRCSRCRHSKNYTCASCGSSLKNARAVRCKDCSWFSKLQMIKDYQNKPEVRKKLRESSRELYYIKRALKC